MSNFKRMISYLDLDCQYVHSGGTSGGACPIDETLQAPHPQLVEDPLEKTLQKFGNFQPRTLIIKISPPQPGKYRSVAN